METLHISVLEGGYTASEIRLQIKKYAGRNVPVRTFAYWKKKVEIWPDEYGLYSEKDLVLLLRLVGWLSRRGKIDAFVEAIKKEQCQNAQ